MGYRTIPADLAPHFNPYDRLDAEQADFIDGLRSFADFLTEHPEFVKRARPVVACRFTVSAGNFLEIADEIDATDSEDDGEYRRLVRSFGPHRVYVYTDARPVGVPVDADDFHEAA